MTDSATTPDRAPALRVAPSPHLAQSAFHTRGMMIDVLIALVPVLLATLLVFRWHGVVQVGLCVLACVAAEAVFCLLMRKPIAVGDCSAAVTGVILGLSLPATAPWFVGLIASFVAIGLGKVVFGGLGYNLFNPAMVGRAFVMLSFAGYMGASAYVVTDSLDVLTQATPLTMAKQNAAAWAAGQIGPAHGLNISRLRIAKPAASRQASVMIGMLPFQSCCQASVVRRRTSSRNPSPPPVSTLL